MTTDAADASASGPDIGKTWGLSDAAASVLYPDVDDAPPPQVNPADEQVPPPFAQRPSPLLDIVRMYGAGHTDWPQTKQALIDFDYAPLPAPTGSPTGPTAGQWYADVENNAQGPEVPGSWPELVAAADHGMITQQELDEVLAARAAKGQDAGQPAAPGPTEGKAWSDAARKAAYESRLKHLHSRLGADAGTTVADAAHGSALSAADHDVVLEGHGIRQDGGSRVSEDEIAKHVREDHGVTIRYANVLTQPRDRYKEDPTEVHARLHGADTTADEGQRITDTIKGALDEQGVGGQWWGDKSNGLMPLGHRGETGYSVHDHGTHLRIHVPTAHMPGVQWDKSNYRDYGDGPEPDWSPVNPEAGHAAVAAAVEKATGRKPSRIELGGYSSQGEEQIGYNVIVPKAAAEAEALPQLPRTRRTTPFDNGTRVRHEDGRTGKVEHISVSRLRKGDTLINPVTGAHAGTVTSVRPIGGDGKARDVEADDRTMLGADRRVEVDGKLHGVMAMGARYTRFVPDPAPDAVPAEVASRGTVAGRAEDHEFSRIAFAGDLKPGDLIELHEGYLHRVGGEPQYVPPMGRETPGNSGHYNVPIEGSDRPARMIRKTSGGGNVRLYKPRAT